MRKFHFEGMAYAEDKMMTCEDVVKSLKEKIQYYTEKPPLTFNVGEVKEILNEEQKEMLNTLLSMFANQPDLHEHDKEMAYRLLGITKGK